MTTEKGLSRRQFIPGALGAAAALGVGGVIGDELHPEVEPPPAKTSSSKPEQTNVDPASAADMPRFILIAPRVDPSAGPAQEGVMMIDRRGRLVWFKPITADSDFDFNAQSYDGNPVLTWWQGRLEAAHG